MPMAKQLLAFAAFVLIIFLFGSVTTTEARKAAYDGLPVGAYDIIADVPQPSTLQADDITDDKRPRPPDGLQPDDQTIGVKRPRPPDSLEPDQIIGVKRPRPPDVLEPDQSIGVKRPRPPDVLEPDQTIGVKRPRSPKLQADPPPISLFATISDLAHDTTPVAKNLVVHSRFSTESKVPPTPSTQVVPSKNPPT